MSDGRFRPGRIVLYVFLVGGLVFMLAPIAIVVVESFNSSDPNGVKPSDHEPVLAVFDVR